MKISVYNQEREVLVQTISLRKNAKDPNNVYLFRCPYCGNAIAQIQGKVSKIMPGLEPTQSVVVMHKCAKCNLIYNFQSINNPLITPPIRTILTQNKDIVVTFHCYICRTPLLQFKDNMIMSLPQFSKFDIPSEMSCFGTNCNEIYQIVDMV